MENRENLKVFPKFFPQFVNYNTIKKRNESI